MAIIYWYYVPRITLNIFHIFFIYTMWKLSEVGVIILISQIKSKNRDQRRKKVKETGGNWQCLASGPISLPAEPQELQWAASWPCNPGPLTRTDVCTSSGPVPSAPLLLLPDTGTQGGEGTSWTSLWHLLACLPHTNIIALPSASHPKG